MPTSEQVHNSDTTHILSTLKELSEAENAQEQIEIVRRHEQEVRERLAKEIEATIPHNHHDFTAEKEQAFYEFLSILRRDNDLPDDPKTVDLLRGDITS